MRVVQALYWLRDGVKGGAPEDRRGLFLATANRLDTPLQNMEKDFWGSSFRSIEESVQQFTTAHLPMYSGPAGSVSTMKPIPAMELPI